MIQECCGGTTVQGAVIINNIGNSYIGFYKTPAINNVRITRNKLLSNVTKTALIYVNADTNTATHAMYNVKIEENEVNGSILAKASGGGSGNEIRNNWGSRGNIRASCHVKVAENTNFLIKSCAD